MASQYIALILSFTTVPCASFVMAGEATTLANGVYSGEHAARGVELFNANCAECHDAAFFEQSQGNQVNEPVTYLFQEILVTMPLTAPD
jgi:mono/diheme cytochrome c family protein